MKTSIARAALCSAAALFLSLDCARGDPSIEIPLGSNSGYFCTAQGGKPVLVRKRFTGLVLPVKFELAIRAISSRVRFLILLRALFRLANDTDRLLRVSAEISSLLELRAKIRQCKDGSIFNNSGPFAQACQAAGGSTPGFSQSSEFPAAQIVNGSDCQPGDSPVVRVYTLNAGGGILSRCSGVVVSPRVVVSSAHCFAGFTASVRILSGKGEFSSSVFERHPDFSFRNNPFEANDIAVIVFPQDLPLRTFDLLRENDFVVGERAVVAGYGRDENAVSEVFRAGDMSVQSFSEAVLYADYDGSRSNTCDGDSGGPLLVYRGARWLLGGVISSGLLADCGVGDVASFTNVSDPGNLEFLDLFL